jgi:hypothetical protein
MPLFAGGTRYAFVIDAKRPKHPRDTANKMATSKKKTMV